MSKANTELVTVCSNCLRACCFQGIFLCDNFQIAGTVEKTVKELKELNLENSCYWENEDTNYEKMFGVKCSK